MKTPPQTGTNTVKSTCLTVEGVQVEEVQAKAIFVKSSLPDTDYVANPYGGCLFGCTYCYASFMGRFQARGVESWGNYLQAKVNAGVLARAQLAGWIRRGYRPSVLLSSVTDPYQFAEKRYRLSRSILEAFVAADYRGTVGILTKSPLVLRDIDLLQSLAHVEVGMTITTDQDHVSRILEVRAPSVSSRLQALATLHKRGINTYAFVGPLLPEYLRNPSQLDILFMAIAAAGVRSIYVERLNLSPYISARVGRASSKARDLLQSSESVASAGDLDEVLKRCGLSLRLGRVIEHANRSTPQAPEWNA